MISWLKNSVIALAIAGLYSIVLVLLRTPQLNKFITDQSIFKLALVIHVNLSVLVWLLSITCCIWSLAKIKSGYEAAYTKIAFAGMLLMAVSTLYPESMPVMNNYVPMLENIVFIIGLSLFGAVVLCFAVQTMFCSLLDKSSVVYGQRIITTTQFTSAVMFVGVWICFGCSYIGIDRLSDIVPLDIDYYYEMLFWSGGHLLQFVYTQVLMLALLCLVEAWKGGKVIYGNLYEMLFALNFVLSLTIFIGHIRYDVADGAFKEFFTKHMIYTGGIVPTVFILLLFAELMQKREKQIPKFVAASFLSSTFLFLSGGLIGVVISGVNVTIPAHYHGSIVGISVAFMGLAYLICFKGQVEHKLSHRGGVLGCLYENIRAWRGSDAKETRAYLQIYIITLGQLLHVAGLALAGGYGVLRKAPGDQIPLSAKVYMGMVGGGGLIAIIGGLMFVYICAKNLYSFKRNY